MKKVKRPAGVMPLQFTLWGPFNSEQSNARSVSIFIPFNWLSPMVLQIDPDLSPVCYIIRHMPVGSSFSAG